MTATTATFIIEENGQLTAEGIDTEELERLLGPSAEVNCGRPRQGVVRDLAPSPHGIRVHRLYHGSVVDGPGVRSVLQVQGCPIRCKGCYVPKTHAVGGGMVLSGVDVLAALTDSTFGPQDGITIMGGEPLAQASQLVWLADEITARRGIHLTIYTGYTVEHIRDHGTQAQVELLRRADLVIDGPFVQSLADNVGEWRGSRNQRVLSRRDVRGILHAN